MKISIPVLFGCSGVSFALGFALAWQILPTAPATAPAATQAAQNASATAAGGNQVADLWNTRGSQENAAAHRPDSEPVRVAAPGVDEEQKMRERAQTDSAYLRSLIQRYEAERKPEVRDMIKSVLATVQKPEALAFFARMATSSDPGQRKEGYAMLQQIGVETPEMRALLKQALANEQSPELLAQAIAALRPTAVDPSESEAILAQLGTLTQHPDANVRTQSVLQLAQWDKTGANQGRIAQALSDPAQEVRQAAVFAVAQSGARSDALKSALLSIASNNAENKAIKGSALQVLERFSMNKEEYARYMQARTQAGL